MFPSYKINPLQRAPISYNKHLAYASLMTAHNFYVTNFFRAAIFGRQPAMRLRQTSRIARVSQQPQVYYLSESQPHQEHCKENSNNTAGKV